MSDNVCVYVCTYGYVLQWRVSGLPVDCCHGIRTRLRAIEPIAMHSTAGVVELNICNTLTITDRVALLLCCAALQV